MNKIIWILSLLALVIIFFIHNGINAKLTAKQYVINTYMYIMLAIIIASAELFILEKNKDIYDSIIDSALKYSALIILTFASMFFVALSGEDKQIQKHIAWGLFVLCIGFLSYSVFENLRANNYFGNVLTTLILIIAVFSWLAFNRPLDTFTAWGSMLGSILGGLIVFESLDLLFFRNYNKPQSFIRRERVYSWIGITLFIAYLLHDTQKLIINANKSELLCDKDIAFCPDYPTESLGIFLDISNLFVNLTNVANTE